MCESGTTTPGVAEIMHAAGLTSEAQGLALARCRGGVRTATSVQRRRPMNLAVDRSLS